MSLGKLFLNLLLCVSVSGVPALLRAEDKPKRWQIFRTETNPKPWRWVDRNAANEENKPAEDAPPPATVESTQEYLKKFREYLDEHIIGQPEVTNLLYEWEYETAVMGTKGSVRPNIMVLMGLPGTGKDTTVQEYSKAQFIDDLEEFSGGALHFIKVEPQKTSRDAWALLGSATGYVGSNNKSELIRFMANHSTGKYSIAKTFGPGGVVEKVVENAKRIFKKKGNGYPAHKGTIFLNEFQNWSQEAKDVILKDLLEYGRIPINAPNGGVAYMSVEGIRIIIATNEGAELLTNKDLDGHQFGASPTSDELQERWQAVYQNKKLLKDIVAETSTRNSHNDSQDTRVGTSDAILSRIPTNNFILLKPPTPEDLQKIARLKLKGFAKKMVNADGIYGGIQIAFSDDLVRFIQEYDYVPEEAGRTIEGKFVSGVKIPFFKAIRENNISKEDLQNGVYLDVKKNEDKTYSLLITKGLSAGSPFLEQVIPITLKEKDNQPISDERIKELSTVGEKIKQQVFNADEPADALGRAVLLAEEARHVKRINFADHERATVFGFFGLSSTGKSEMVKALTRVLYPKEGLSKRADIDCNKIKYDIDMKKFIWGDGKEASEFMKLYDRNRGNFVLVLEEASNIPKELLKSLYDLLREAHPKFSDGKDRPMTNVTIVLTGNTGANWYEEIPMDLPLEVRMAAMARVYKESIKVPEFLRKSLNETFPEPLTNRIGLTNITFFGPHTFKSVRELTILKTAEALENLKSTNLRRGWNVGFRNEEDKNLYIEIAEREGFNLYEQGAAIDRYAHEQLGDKLRELLLRNLVPTNRHVVIVPRRNQTDEVLKKQGGVLFDIYVEGFADPLTLRTSFQERKVFPKQNIVDQKITAAHEAGHELVGRVLLSDKFQSDFVTIIPGVTKINDKWLYYLGLASKEEIEQINLTHEAGIRILAQLLAGAEGERAVTIGVTHSAGKSNDIERATQIAENMVVKWGLVPDKWGYSSYDLTKMSPERHALKEELVKEILDKARTLAEQVLIANKETHLELTRLIARKGEVKKAGLEDFYSKNAVNTDVDKIRKIQISDRSKDDITQYESKTIPELNLPDEEVANIADLIAKEKREQIAQARVVKELPIYEGFKIATAHNNVQAVARETKMETVSCEFLFH